jgi:hypothetical protein
MRELEAMMVRRAWLLGLAAGATVLWVATVNALLNLTASAFNVHAYRWWLLITSVIVSLAAGTVAGIQRAAHHHGQDARESAHHQLPMDIDEFTGRLEQLRQLDRLVTRPASGTAAPVIWAISGMPGAGKTRLAIHAAHVQVSAGRFTDIQLSVDLSGFDPARAADPAAVLDRFLRVLDVPPAKIPVELDARSALYRSQLSGRKGIILLDNAASAEQVRPLLPGTPEILVIVTSRRSLGSLDGCQPLLLEPFRPHESLELLTRIAGSERVGNEPEAATRVTELCAHLPYAVTLAARRILIRRTWTIRYLADRLRPADHRLDELGRPHQALRMSFDLSYDTVDSEQRRVLGLLALHPGKDATVPSVAALGNIPAAQAEQVLEDLLDVSLLIQETAGRYKVHDLLRLYALERVKGNLSPEDRAVAQVRVVDWYLRTVDAANRQLNSTSRRPEMPETAITPLTFTNYDDALQWCEQERANLLAAAELAAIMAPETAWKLAVALWRF